MTEDPSPKVPEQAANPSDPLEAACKSQTAVRGKVIGWNNGGFHVVIDGRTGFCPRSEMGIGADEAPETLVDKEFEFRVLRLEKKGKRIVLSRRAQLHAERRSVVADLEAKMEAGEVLTGTVKSLTDFGAFVDLGGVQGLLHISEISRKRLSSPAEVLEEGQEVRVQVLKMEKGKGRISLSMKRLEPDPWQGIEAKFPQGTVVKGTVEKAADFGALVEIAPGLTGLLPKGSMALPSNTTPPRIYTVGKEVSVQVLNIDRRRRRISLALEGTGTEATNTDVESYRKKQSDDDSSFNALAAAFARAGTRSED